MGKNFPLVLLLTFSFSAFSADEVLPITPAQEKQLEGCLIAASATLHSRKAAREGRSKLINCIKEALPYSIKNMQLCLLFNNIDIGEPDGVLGAKTIEGVKEMERRSGLPVTGKPNKFVYNSCIVDFVYQDN